ncbi:MATE family efflux transporter [Bacillus horti]|uniref:MATE family efflux protein n=1 Tax=Caldalkalibacillus horti TaxID=77523 RepID=A0ABT9W315_9BACI|nr:MATE family efflux transporter [Bacillus horti]MDQ0167510.1 putative MATE family efflux protein [Bacillus horti]
MSKQTIKKMTLFTLTWPIFIELLLHMFMGSADTLMLSQYSDNSVAAVGLANQILNMVIVMFGFIAVGTSVIIAQFLGAKQEKEASEVVIVSITANIVFSLVLSVVLFVFAERFLIWMNVPPELMDEALIYTKVVGGFSFLTALVMTVGAAIKSYGFTKDAMYVTIGMNILNILGNFISIYGPFGLPVLGVEGVAISTAISRLIGLIIITVLLFKRIEHKLPFNLLFRFHKGHLSKLLKIGVPSAGEHLAYNTSQLLIVYFITMLGTEMLTTRVYTVNLMMFILVFASAIAQGTQILIGHKVGAGDHNGAYQLCMRSLRYSMVISLGMAAIITLFSDSLFGIFTDNQSIIALGGTLIMLCMLLEPGRCFNLVIISSLRAAGDVKFPVYLGIASMFGVSVTLAYLLGIHFGLGLIGVWIAFIADEWLRGLLMLWRWRSRVWERMTFVKQKG